MHIFECGHDLEMLEWCSAYWHAEVRCAAVESIGYVAQNGSTRAVALLVRCVARNWKDVPALESSHRRHVVKGVVVDAISRIPSHAADDSVLKGLEACIKDSDG